MSETKHTPGPWRESWVRPDKTKGHDFVPTCAILGIDKEFGEVRLADIADPVDTNAEANARLVAAAPELLEILTKLLDRFERICMDADGCTDKIDVRLIKAARTEIAKAKGEA